MKLIKPNLDYEEQYIVFIAAWEKELPKKEWTPFSLTYDYNDFPRLIARLEQEERIPPNENFVTLSTYWLLDNEDNIVGASSLRHYLNEQLLYSGGHIGYGIMKPERNKGYATQLLALTLLEAKKREIEKVMLTCDRQNIGSAKVILNNGGVFHSEFIAENGLRQRYWIDNSNQ